MQFQDPIASGNVLVRDALQSPDYVSGLSGWAIKRDGTAEFNNGTFRGNLQSANYVPNVSGWHLDSVTGSAEFQDFLARGTFSTDTAGERIVITESGAGARVELWSGDPDENAASFIQTAIVGTDPKMNIRGPQVGHGGINLSIDPPVADGDDTTTGALTVSSTSGFGEPFLVNFGNVISDALVNVKGRLWMETPWTAGAHDSTTRTTVSTAYGAAAGTCNLTRPYVPPSGQWKITVQGTIANSGATDSAFLSFEVRDTNAAGAVLLAATDLNAIRKNGTGFESKTMVRLLNVATPTPIFVRAMMRSSVATNTASFDEVDIIVEPVY